MKTLVSALLCSTALVLVGLSATPASAHEKPCCYNGGRYFNASPSTCYRYGGRVIRQEYCQRNYYQGGYGYDQGYYGGYGNNGGYGDNDDWRRRRHHHHDRDDWGGEGRQHGWNDHRDRDDSGEGGQYGGGGEGDRR